MVTRRGWLTLTTALALAAAGRVLGVLELYLLAGTIGIVLVGAVIWSRLKPLSLLVERSLHPSRIHAGQQCTVELTLTNQSRRRSPTLSVRDAISSTRGADLMVGPLDPGGAAGATYQLPTEHRGILRIGPLDVTMLEPFGLADSTTSAAGITELTVYPRVDAIAPVPQTTGNDPMAGAEHPNALGRSGEDFYALRHYTIGDDLRRVHWPSTARHDELMVRQDELPWQGRATVLADTRAAANNAASLELVISAAASVVAASARREDLLRLATTDGYDSAFAAGHAHVGAIMEHLAATEAGPDDVFERATSRLVRSSTGGALVVLSAGLRDTEIDLILKMKRVFGSIVLVWFEASSWDGEPDTTTGVGRSAPAMCIPVGGPNSFADVWNNKMRTTKLDASWIRNRDDRGAWAPTEPSRHEFDPFARRTGAAR